MNRIRELRLKAGLTQKKLGEMLHLEDAAISKYEKERVPLTAKTLIELSKIFDVSVDYILCISDVRNVRGDRACVPEKRPAGQSEFEKTCAVLSEEEKKKAKEYMDFLISQRGKRTE